MFNGRGITQAFPWLLPFRKAQRKFCFYMKMHFDGNRYAKTKTSESLPAVVYESKTLLLNSKTGFDLLYQNNKVYNLQIAVQPVNGILIRPQETFSFWQIVRKAGGEKKYKEGLSIENGKLKTVARGGLCQLSNFLFWMFLHTPLTIIERHPHRKKEFPSQDETMPDGVDATVSEGWLDLKIKNDTHLTFQIQLCFDKDYLKGRILADRAAPYRYNVINRNKKFFERDKKKFEQVVVCRQKINYKINKIESVQLLYTDEFEIGYPLFQETGIAAIKETSYEKSTEN